MRVSGPRRWSVSSRIRILLSKPRSWDLPSRRALTLLHPFPAPMPLALARAIIGAATDPESVILDPMAGSGTVLTAARQVGRVCYLFDLDPLSVLMMQVASRTYDTQQVEKEAQRVLSHARALSQDRERVDRLFDRHVDEETKKFIRFWFPPKSVRGVFALSREIRHVGSEKIRRILALALSRAIIAKMAGVSKGIDIPHTRPHIAHQKSVPDPLEVFPKRVRELLLRLDDSPPLPMGTLQVRNADARKLPLRNSSVDLVLTSSPYASAIDYIRAHKFSLVWMGYSISRLRRIRARLIGAENSERAIRPDLVWLEGYLPHDKPEARKRAVLRRYFYDMDRVLQELHRVLKPGGACVLILGRSTVGGFTVDTPTIIAKLAETHGFEHMASRSRRVNPYTRSLPFLSAKVANPLGKRIERETIVALGRR